MELIVATGFIFIFLLIWLSKRKMVALHQEDIEKMNQFLQGQNDIKARLSKVKERQEKGLTIGRELVRNTDLLKKWVKRSK